MAGCCYGMITSFLAPPPNILVMVYEIYLKLFPVSSGCESKRALIYCSREGSK
jgi:hypothetical protein